MRLLIILLTLFLGSSAFASEPLPWQMVFQTAASPLMEELDRFHVFLLIICTAIVIFICILMAYVCYRFHAKRNPVPANFSHNWTLEIIWTVIPIIILVIIAIPSFRVLHYVEKPPTAELTVKVVGYQWYWHYIYPDNDNIEYDSYIIKDADLKPGQKRLLEVDRRLVLPENTVIKFLITAGDVVHSFAVPSLGIKTDAVPGRINESWTKVLKKGIYYGQCSELCGVNHGFMPIAIEVVSKEDFEKWVNGNKTAQQNALHFAADAK